MLSHGVRMSNTVSTNMCASTQTASHNSVRDRNERADGTGTSLGGFVGAIFSTAGSIKVGGMKGLIPEHGWID